MTNPCLYYSHAVGRRKGTARTLELYLFFMRADLFILTEKHVSSHSIPRADGQMHFQ